MDPDARPRDTQPGPDHLGQTEGLTDIQRDILATVRDFVDKEILPVATELEHRDVAGINEWLRHDF